MAEFDYGTYGDIPRSSPDRAKHLVTVVGAVTSLVMVCGLGVWGYDLAQRDITGIPVIRAAEGPLREAPVIPGGEIAEHRGMAVTVVAEEGGVAPLPEEIILAPEAIELADEDVAGLKTLAEADAAANDALALATDPTDLVPVAPVPATTEEAVALALAEALGIDSAPLADLLPEDSVAPSVTHPKPRPRTLTAAMAPAAAVAAPVVEIDPATLATGTRLVQLGAFDSTEAARAEWVKLGGRFGGLLAGKSMVLQTAVSGGRTFYRLRAHGFEGLDDARRFCAALLAEDAACIPVVHR